MTLANISENHYKRLKKMRPRRDIESKRKELQKKSFQTDYDLGQISILNWILENWDWEEEKAVLESRLKADEMRKSPI